MTRSPVSPASRLVSSSVSPSAKYGVGGVAQVLERQHDQHPRARRRDRRGRGTGGARAVATSSPPTSSAIASAAAMPAYRPHGPAAPADEAARRPSLSSPRPHSATANSAAVSNRSAGWRASARLTTASTAGGRPGRTIASDGGRSTRRRAMMARGFGPVKGGEPLSISYTTTASE